MTEGKKTIEIIKKMQPERPVVCVFVCVLDKNRKEILLIKREKKPYKGYYALVGGKMELGETVKEAALRELLEETGLHGNFIGINAIFNENLKSEKDSTFTAYVVSIEVKSKEFVVSEEGELEWFRINELPENMIPNDRFVVENRLAEYISICECVIEEKGGMIIDYKIEDA